jgi:hypothetical protein
MQIVKALLVRNHPGIAQHVDRFFAAFLDPCICRDAAKALGKLGAGGESILTKENYAVLGVGLHDRYTAGLASHFEYAAVTHSKVLQLHDASYSRWMSSIGWCWYALRTSDSWFRPSTAS